MPAHHTPANSLDSATEVRAVADVLLRHSARLVVSSSQRKIVSGLCEALTTATPNILLAWTWFGVKETTQIKPQIVAGPASSYADSLVIEMSDITKRGPAFRALAGERSDPTVVSTSSPFGPWRNAATLYGIRSSLALPLRSSADGLGGIFVLYARHPDYFECVGLSLFEALAELFAALLSAASARLALETDANSDALTGLGNRRMVHAAELSVHRRNDASERASVLVIDIDHFKQVNDRHGHSTGDHVLRELAILLRSKLRSTDFVMRWGGEEFVVCIPGTALEDAIRIAEVIRAGVASHSFDGGSVRVTVSIGLVELDVGMPLNLAIDKADAALFSAKRAGRNCVRVSSQTRDEPVASPS